MKKLPVLQVSLWLRLVVPTIVIYIIINWVLYGHLKYLYRTVLLYSFKLLLSSWPERH